MKGLIFNRMAMKRIIGLLVGGGAIILALITIIVLVRRSAFISPSISDQPNISVIATFYPLAYLAERVGGEHVTLTTIVPNGTEPHDYTPLPRDIQAIYNSDLLLANGLGIDNWAEDLEDDFLNDRHITLVVGEEIDLSATLKSAEEDKEDVGQATDEDGHDGIDPHIWLDPILQQTVVTRVQHVLSQIDPIHASEYEQQADALLTDLQQLDRAYTTGLANCALQTIIVSHDAFAYVGARYDFTIVSIAGLNPNSVPSAKTLADLTARAKDEGIEYIFFETLVNPALSQALASEVGAETLVLNPLEGLTPAEQTAGEDYLSVMRHNVTNLRTGLRCE